MMSVAVRIVLSDISGQGKYHLREVEEDLAQTHLLLTEAIAKLANSFDGISKAIATHRKILDALGSEDTENESGRNGKDVLALRGLSQDLAQHISAAVTGLQFEDMTSQLIGRMQKRVEGMRIMLALLEATETLEKENAEFVEQEVVLLQMSQQIRAESQRVDAQLRKAVGQRHMESGEIELF
jgi:hypothetical protein